MATEEQAKSINDLSYRLYKYHGAKDSSDIFTYGKAIELSPSIADQLINDFKKEIEKIEVNLSLLNKRDILRKKYPNLELNLAKFRPVSIIENYRYITNIEINNDVLMIKLNESNKVFSFKKEDVNCTKLLDVYQLCKNSIDFGVPLNIFIYSGKLNIFSKKEYNKTLVTTFNRTLELLDYYLPVKFAQTVDIDTLKVTLDLIDNKDNKLAKDMELLMNTPQCIKIFNIIFKTEMFFYTKNLKAQYENIVSHEEDVIFI